MRRKPYLLILSICFLYIFLPQESLAGNYIVTPVTSESQLVDGGSYVICYKDTKGKYFNMKGKPNEAAEGLIEYNSDNKGDTNQYTIINKSTIFQIKNEGGNWYLWDSDFQTYIGENHGQGGQRSLMQSYETPNESCLFGFIDVNGELNIKIGEKVIRYNTS